MPGVKIMRLKSTIAATTRHVLTFSMIAHKLWQNSDVVMNAMASEITAVSTVWSTVCWGAQIKKNIKALRHWPLCGESTDHRWIPTSQG